MTEYTPNLNLDLYESTDKPNLRDQYNSAMTKLDTTVTNQNVLIAAIDTIANNAKDTADGVKATVDTQLPLLQTAIEDETTNRQNADSALEDAIEAVDQRIDNLRLSGGGGFRGANVIWIGDSWTTTGTNGVTRNHVSIVPEALGFANTYGSYIGSRGYCRYDETRPTYLTSLQQIANDGSIDNATINYIIVEGSINDNTYSTSNIIQAMETFWAYAKQTFPNAQGIVIPTMGNNTHTAMWEKCALANRNGAKAANVPYIKGGHWLLWNQPAIWNADNVHVNQGGQEIIARALIVGLRSGNMNVNTDKTIYNTTFSNFTVVTSGTGHNIPASTTNVMLVDDMVYFSGEIDSNINSVSSDCALSEVWQCDVSNMCMDSDYMFQLNEGTGVDMLKNFNGIKLAGGVCQIVMGYSAETDSIRIYGGYQGNHGQYYNRIVMPIARVAIGVND